MTKNILIRIENDVAPFCAERNLPYAAIRFKPPPDTETLPPEYLVYDVISDPDVTFFSGSRKDTNYRIQFDYVVDADADYKLTTVPDELETWLMSRGYKPQGNARYEYDKEVNKTYYQKDYMIRIKRSD